MLTGDHLAISKETARQLGLGQNIYDPKQLGLGGVDVSDKIKGSQLFDYIEGADGFAQVFPEHKFQVVDFLQRRGHVVAMTGDGVNDAPSLKKANVGMAVKGATDAARAASDIVFLTPGLGVIIDAIITSRKIFHRMQGFLQYRVALSIHILVYLTTALILFQKTLPSILVIFCALFSDATVLMIAYDRAPFAKKPVRWNMSRLFGVAIVLAITLSFGTYLLHAATLVQPTLEGFTEPIVFLEIILTQSWLVFSTRTHGPFYEQLPSWQLALAVLAVDILASCFVLFGWFVSTSIPFLVVVQVWLFSAGIFIICDAVQQYFNESAWFDRLVHGRLLHNDRTQEDKLYQLMREAAKHERIAFSADKPTLRARTAVKHESD
jgi:H+-transporting ATPase